MNVGIAPTLPYEVILGRDWPHFKNLVSLELDSFPGMPGETHASSLGEEQRTDPTLQEA